MLGSIGAAGAADWSVLIMDPVSTRVMSHACQISEILDYGISCKALWTYTLLLASLRADSILSWLQLRMRLAKLQSYPAFSLGSSICLSVHAVVENIEKKREPLLSISGVYFITPTDRSVQRLVDDWKARPQYKTAHVFFTSKLSPIHLQVIKNCAGLAQRLRSLKEVNTQLAVQTFMYTGMVLHARHCCACCSMNVSTSASSAQLQVLCLRQENCVHAISRHHKSLCCQRQPRRRETSMLPISA